MSVTKAKTDNIVSLDASQLSGTLPAMSGAALTGIESVTKNASDPTISTNPSGGVGTLWANTTSGEMFACTDATAGANVWKNIGSGTQGILSATGGNSVATDGDYKVHTFTANGTFTIANTGYGVNVSRVESLIIGGGGGGGVSGGGAGGHLHTTVHKLFGATHAVVVGAGGPNKNNSSFTKIYSNGEDSTFGGLTAIGGGGSVWSESPGNSGGSGGGGGYNGGVGNRQAGTGTAGQGNDGGHGGHSGGSGGGGGAGAVGVASTASSGGNGGAGLSNSITGTAVIRAGGGGGGSSGTDGIGGSGGGGNADAGAAGPGAANTGSGGGGAYNSGAGVGGSGIVIIRYKFQ